MNMLDSMLANYTNRARSKKKTGSCLVAVDVRGRRRSAGLLGSKGERERVLIGVLFLTVVSRSAKVSKQKMQ